MSYDEINNNFVEKHGKKNINIFVLIELKRENKEDIVFVTKGKTPTYNAPLKRNLFD